MSFQTDLDSLLGGGVSVFNLALNVAGIINNNKNVAIFLVEEETTVSDTTSISGNTSVNKIRKTNILEGALGRLGGITSIASKIDGTGVVMSAEIIEESKLTEHPLENGQVLADNKVKLPTVIDVKVTLPAVDYKDMIDNIKKYKNKNKMFRIETKFGSYDNMQIISLPCNLNVDNVERLTFNIKFREVLIMSDIKTQTASDNDTDTINTGTTTGIGTILNRVVFG